MTKTEIDRRLAFAIGYTADRVRIHPLSGVMYVQNDRERCDGPPQFTGWQRFDHTDSEVFRHVAERFDAFPMRWNDNKDWVAMVGSVLVNPIFNRCPATASALAVIKYVEANK